MFDKKELTVRIVVIASILAVIFGMANAYIGLKVGMTVSASIPAAVLAMGLMKLFGNSNILEANIAQTLASAGESLAAGVIFTVPAFILLGGDTNWLKIFLFALIGGLLGVLFMIPLRKFLIEEEDKNLPYPEGRACAEVLKAPEKKGAIKVVLIGLFIGFLFKVLIEIGAINEFPLWHLKSIKGGVITFDLLPSLLAIGFIIGYRISALMLVGAFLGWYVIMPLIYESPVIVKKYLNINTGLLKVDVYTIWNDILRYIGAGAVALGGFIGVIKSFPDLVSSVRLGLKNISSTETSKDISLKKVFSAIFVLAIVLFFVFPILGLNYSFKIKLLAVSFVIVFSFLFVSVSSRIVGLVGSSSNPISGMTIATLVFVALVFTKLGINEPAVIMSIGAFVCIAMAIAGDTSQDLKTGFLVKATPYKQQIAEMIGVIVSSIFIGWTLLLLGKTYGFGTKQLPAPQANLMRMVVSGIVNGNLPWNYIFIGAMAALNFELLGIASLPVAVGLYLPLELSTTIMIGGILRYIYDKLNYDSQTAVIFSSGIIAGEALTGIFISLLLFFNVKVKILKEFLLGNYTALIILILIGIIPFILGAKNEKK